jgi:hypothetical protein
MAVTHFTVKGASPPQHPDLLTSAQRTWHRQSLHWVFQASALLIFRPLGHITCYVVEARRNPAQQILAASTRGVYEAVQQAGGPGISKRVGMRHLKAGCTPAFGFTGSRPRRNECKSLGTNSFGWTESSISLLRMLKRCTSSVLPFSRLSTEMAMRSCAGRYPNQCPR